MKRELILLGIIILGVFIFVPLVSADFYGLPLYWNVSGYTFTPSIVGSYHHLPIYWIVLSGGSSNYHSISDLTASVGTSWILWTWNYTNATTNASIYIDGIFATNTALQQYGLTDLNPREKHRIDLVEINNVSLVLASDAQMTLYPNMLFYILIGLSLGFLILELIFTKAKIFCILFGLICFFISIVTFYLSFTFYLSPFSYLMVGIAAIAVVWILGALFTMLSESRSYEEGII